VTAITNSDSVSLIVFSCVIGAQLLIILEVLSIK
jgi:hypothetical protein